MLSEVLIFRGRLIAMTALFFLPHALGAVAVVAMSGVNSLISSFLPARSAGSDRVEYLVTQVPVTLRYLHLWLMPHDLTVEQAFPILWDSATGTFVKTHTEAARIFWEGVLGHALILLLWIMLLLRRHRFIPLAIAWFYLTNIVESSFIPILDPMVDHRMYVPLALLPAAVAVAVTRSMPTLIAWSSRARTAVTLATMALVLVLAGGTIVRVSVWWSAVGLWEDTLHKRPDCARAYSSLGMEHLYEQEWLAAVGPIETALRLGPYHVEGWNNLGKAYLELERWKDAERALLRGIQVNDIVPSNSVRMCWNNVGLVYIELANREEDEARRVEWLRKAVTHLDKATKLDQLYEVAYLNRSSASYKLMRLTEGDGREQLAKDVVEAVSKARQVAHMRGHELSLTSHRRLCFALLELDRAEDAYSHLLSVEGSFSKERKRMVYLDLLGQLAISAHVKETTDARKLLEAAAQKLDSAMEEGGEMRSRLLLTRGEIADFLGNRDRALRLIREGLKKDPFHPRAKALRKWSEGLERRD